MIYLTSYSLYNILQMEEQVKTIKKESQVQKGNHQEVRFITPLKDHKDSNLRYFYKSPNIQNITHQVRQITNKKFKEVFYTSKEKHYVLRSDIKRISSPLIVNPNVNTSMNLYQIIQVNQRMRKNIEASLKNNKIFKENLIDSLTSLDLSRNHVQYLRRRLQEVKAKKRAIIEQGENGIILKQKSTQVQSTLRQKTQFLASVNHSLSVLQGYKAKTTHQLNSLWRSIEEQRQLMSVMEVQATCLKEKALSRQKSQISNSNDIIHCMFLVGILREQLFILGPEKKRQRMRENKNNKVEILNKLSNRTIRIQCHNSNIVHYQILTSIYMHAKSITINNLHFVMNRISFFSDDFKHLYDYHHYLHAFQTLIEKLISSKHHPIKLKETPEYDFKTKKTLTIVAQGQQLGVIRWVLKQMMGNEGYMLRVFGCILQVRGVLWEERQRNAQQSVVKIELNRLDLNNYL